MMGLKKIILLQALLVYCAILAKAEKIMRPKLKDLKIWSDNVYVSHTAAFDPADPHVNISMNVLQELHDVDIHAEGQIVQKQDSNYFLTFNSSINLCRIINWRNQSPIGTLIHAYLKEYGNLVETCPIAKAHYNMHRFWIPEDTTTALLPEFDFEINFSAYHVDATKKRTLIINDHIAGEAVVQDVNNVKRGILAMLPKAG